MEVCVRVGTRCVGEGYLAKIGIKGMPSNLATAVRTAVVLVFAQDVGPSNAEVLVVK